MPNPKRRHSEGPHVQAPRSRPPRRPGLVLCPNCHELQAARTASARSACVLAKGKHGDRGVEVAPTSKASKMRALRACRASRWTPWGAIRTRVGGRGGRWPLPRIGLQVARRTRRRVVAEELRRARAGDCASQVVDAPRTRWGWRRRSPGPRLKKRSSITVARRAGAAMRTADAFSSPPATPRPADRSRKLRPGHAWRKWTGRRWPLRSRIPPAARCSHRRRRQRRCRRRATSRVRG